MPALPVRRLLVALALVPLAGCAASVTPPAGRTVSDRGTLSGIEVTSWAELDAERVGVTIPLSVIERAPVAARSGTSPSPDPRDAVRLSLPREVTERTFLSHVDIVEFPAGDPETSSPPRLAFRFSGITDAEQRAVTCTDVTPVPADRLPPRYVAGRPGLPPKGDCVSDAGVRAADPRASASGATMALRYDKGMLILLEPAITRDLLLQQRDVTLPIPRPRVVGRDTLYPSVFTAHYDADRRAYDIVVSDFVEVH